MRADVCGCVDSDPQLGSTFGVGVDQPFDGTGSALVCRRGVAEGSVSSWCKEAEKGALMR